jgi:DNA-binding beta-propeller fold protein YncE
MTRHSRSIDHFTTSTKENKVKSPEHTAKSASTPKIGRFATLRGLLQALGSGASARGVVAAPLAALCVLLALCVGVAQAEPPALISYGSFSAHEELAVGVAVDSSGDLFVSSLLEGFYAPSTVVKLDPSGNLLSPPSPFGSAHYSGVAVNPTNGNVYVLGEEGGFLTPATPAMIFVYDPDTGALVSSFEVAASRNFSGVFAVVQIAVDSAGDVYVPNTLENEVLEYSPSGALLKTFTDPGALEEPTGVAVAPSGNLWVASSGDNRIVELDASGAPVEVNGKPAEIDSEGVSSLALDGHGDIFAVVNNSADSCGQFNLTCGHLVEYSAEGRQLADVGAGSFGLPNEYGGTSGRESMVAVNQANGRVYVTDGSKDTVWVFGPPIAPAVGRELTAEVGASEAKLGALVNAGGIQTSYRFEYGPTRAYGNSTPFPEGSVGEGVESHAVWASASSLAPGTTYHYRVVASNELGTVYGPDQAFTTLSAEQSACPNEQLRGGFSAKLPDCRAYELVTLPDKNSSQFDTIPALAYSSMAATNGEAVTLRAAEPQPGAPTAGEQYIATRGTGGWIAEDIVPLESYDGVLCPSGNQQIRAYSDQLTKDVMTIGGGTHPSGSEEGSESCNPEGRRVVSGEPVGYENLLVRENATGAYELVNVTPTGVTPADAHFQAASADLSHVIFTETSPLAAGATYGVENLYEWDESAPRLVSVLPDGTAVPGSLATTTKAGKPGRNGVVSSDGSRILFTYGGALYDRIDGQRTVQVDENRGGLGPSGGGSFEAATADGSEVFFLDESELTADSSAAAGEPDLYECALPGGASKCELTDLTVATVGEHAAVQSVTPLGDHDSSYVYFVAEGVLASNTREFTNSEGTTVVEGAQAGQHNLYLWNGKETMFVDTVLTGESEDGRFAGGLASPDGEWLAFESAKSLTGYDNVKPNGEFAWELFLYNAATGQLACASCDPTGEAPVEEGGMKHAFVEAPRGRHLLTDSGEVFFETPEALVPADTNGEPDVYEYEDGHPHLISSGTSSAESNLEDASESGNDVFFRSSQQLVPQDNQEGETVIYDARVDGGFAELLSPPACTTTDACRAAVPPQPSVYGAPASQTFSGVGNLVPPEAKPKAKPKAKLVKCKGDGSRRGEKKGKCVKKTVKKVKKSVHANRRGKR